MLIGKMRRGPGIAASCSGVVKDDRAQALTEFVLIIPVVLLVFFLMIQYFVIVQTSQVGNYAAFCAARVYAVRASWDTNALSCAHRAAYLAYAPVTKLMPGELPMGNSLGDLANEFTGALPGILGDAAELAEGYFLVKTLRLWFVQGGSVNVSKGGDPEAVKVEINYPYPIFIPGLGNLWELTGGEESMKKDLQSLAEGLNWTYYVFYRGLAPYPYLNIRSRCAMGYEDWSGKVRKKQSVESEETTDPALEAKQGEIKEAQDEYNEATKKVEEAAKKCAEAQKAYDQALAEYKALCADPNASESDKEAAKKKMYDAQQALIEAKGEYNEARAEQIEAQQKLEAASGADLDKPPDIAPKS